MEEHTLDTECLEISDISMILDKAADFVKGLLHDIAGFKFCSFMLHLLMLNQKHTLKQGFPSDTEPFDFETAISSKRV